LPLLEGGESGAPLEEVGVGPHEVPHALLQRYTGHIGKKGGLFLVSEHGHLCVQGLIGQTLPSLLIHLLAQCKRPVVDKSAAAKRAGELLFLLVRGIEAIEIGAFDSAHTMLFFRRR
jgi:hypothetical protein